MTAFEFSRPVEVDSLPKDGGVYSLAANEVEREALAKRFGILGVDRLEGEIQLKPVGRRGVALEGKIVADVRQACVVTLVEVAEHIEETFARRYAPIDPDAEADVTVVLGDKDDPDPLEHGTIDIGEAAAEELALALDPYPRASGAVFEAPTPTDEPKPNPFAALAALKKAP